MGNYAQVSARVGIGGFGARTTAAAVPLRADSANAKSNDSGNGSGDKPTKTSMSLENFIASLERRRYFEPGGAVRDSWNAVYGSTLDEAWDKADDKANSVSLQVEDYQVICVRDAIRAAKWTSEMDKARRRAREAVERGLKGIPGLPPHTKHRAIGDAELLASLIVLEGSGMKGWETHYAMMIGINEIWDCGFGRYAIVDGKHLIYGVRNEELAEKIIRLEQSG